MNLVIDIGNTRIKWAVFNSRHLLAHDHTDELTLQLLGQIFHNFSDINQAILASVRDFPTDCRNLLNEQTDFFIELSHHTPVPIVNRYKTPQTLGLDRLAAAVGAAANFPGRPLLIIDAGTAITIDFVSPSGEYLGGNISPGIGTRYRALNQFTGKLPLVELKDEFWILGDDTESAIRAGVQQGVIFEIESYITHYKKTDSDLVVVLTGGDSAFITRHLKSDVDQMADLTLRGLDEILIFNSNEAEKKLRR